MKENKQDVLNGICNALRLTNAAGNPDNNPLIRIEYIRNGYEEFARPIFEDGSGKGGEYDVCITGDSGIAIFMDVTRQFIMKKW